MVLVLMLILIHIGDRTQQVYLVHFSTYVGWFHMSGSDLLIGLIIF